MYGQTDLYVNQRLSKVTIKYAGVEQLLINKPWLWTKLATRNWILNYDAAIGKTMMSGHWAGWCFCNPLGLSHRSQVSCYSSQHLNFALPHCKAGNVSGGKKDIFSQNDLSDQKNLSKNLPSGDFFMSHLPEFMRWTHHRPVSLGLPRNYCKRPKLIL